MDNLDAAGHVSGVSQFLDDIPVISGTLLAVVVGSPVAGARLKRVHTGAALAIPGVVRIFTAADIPGENQIGSIIADEPLLADKELAYAGQPAALVVATSLAAAEQGRRLVCLEYEEGEVFTDAREAARAGRYLFPPRTFRSGDLAKAWGRCSHIFTGTAGTGAQEHCYLETQGAYVSPGDKGTLLVCSSTQGPAAVQNAVSRVLDLPMNRICVEVVRLGGAFGGKEDQATAWATLASLAACLLNKPVKLVLSRHDDLVMTGKRHPCTADFRIGLAADGKILAWEVTYYQDGGAAADLSPAILERTLLHSTGSYFIPNVSATAISCKTGLPPNTAFRGFGGPQAMFVMESAIALAAKELGVPARVIQAKNLVRKGDAFPYGQVVDDSMAVAAWEKAHRMYGIEEQVRNIEIFNREDHLFRKGLALMPVCFGISFTNTRMNQAHALVHIYQDGSVGVSTGAVEMGQGVNTKLRQTVSGFFSIPTDRVRIESTNTSRIANSSPTAASSGTDLNGKAVLQACQELMVRLRNCVTDTIAPEAKIIEIRDETVWVDGSATGVSWNKLVETALANRISLSMTGYYATPGIGFDRNSEKGRPFAYYVFGTAVVVATVDCLRGTYRFDRVQMVHDFGNSMNPAIDRGQVEGAVVQGIGWMTSEEIRYSPAGKLLSDSLSTYKVPDVYAAPHSIDCFPLESIGPDLAHLHSKAVGEPPLMYGIGAYFALREAIRAFNPLAEPGFIAPLTPEKVLLALYNESSSH